MPIGCSRKNNGLDQPSDSTSDARGARNRVISGFGAQRRFPSRILGKGDSGSFIRAEGALSMVEGAVALHVHLSGDSIALFFLPHAICPIVSELIMN